MCFQLYHECKYCNNQYECSLPNYICPSVNHDEDEFMCDSCRTREAEAYKKWYEKNQNEKFELPTIKDWENE